MDIYGILFVIVIILVLCIMALGYVGDKIMDFLRWLYNVIKGSYILHDINADVECLERVGNPNATHSKWIQKNEIEGLIVVVIVPTVCFLVLIFLVHYL